MEKKQVLHTNFFPVDDNIGNYFIKKITVKNGSYNICIIFQVYSKEAIP